MDLPPWTRPPLSTSLSFSLPVSADVLYFLSRGSLAYGSVKIDLLEEGGDDVAVDVTISYWSDAALERATVCELEREGTNHHGIGIFVRRLIATLVQLSY